MSRLLARFLWVSMVLGGLAASGCAERQTNVERGNSEGVIYLANGDEPESLDIHLSTGSPDYNITMNLFEGLTRLNPQTLEPEPGVAERWEISEDGTRYRFFLRENARWSNGEPVSAQDFVFAWRRGLTPTFPHLYAYMMYVIKNAERFNKGEITDFEQVGIKAVNDRELLVELENPTPYFLQLLNHHSFYPLPEEVVLAHGAIDDANNRWIRPENMVANGAFRLTRWEINNVIELTKNPHYWDADNVRLNGAQFFPIEDKDSEERAFRSGQVHATNTPQMAVEKIAVYQAENPQVLRAVRTYATYFYEFNNEVKPLDQVAVRRALSMAIDREALVKNVTKGNESPAHNLVPPDPNGFQPKQYFKDDVAEARRLLAEAGYPNGQGFPRLTLLYNNDTVHRQVALAVQQMWRVNLGIDVQLENQEWKVYINTRNSGVHQIARAGWVADYVDPSNFFEVYLSYGGNNRARWRNSTYDQLVEAAGRTGDQAERFKLFEQASQILAEDMPIAPVFYYTDLNLVSTAVKGWYDNVMHYHPLRTVWLEP